MSRTHEPGKPFKATRGKTFLRAVEPLLVEIELRMKAMDITSLSLANVNYCLIRTITVGGDIEAELIGKTDHLEGDSL